MRRNLCIFMFGVLGGLVLASLVWTVSPASSSPDKGFPSRSLLDALAFVESSNNPRAISSAGARGLYQLMPATWGDMMTQPFDQAFNPVTCELAAVRYLEWLKATLTKWMGSTPDVIDILSCWHGGIGRYRDRNYSLAAMPDATKEFVVRVVARMRTPNN